MAATNQSKSSRRSLNEKWDSFKEEIYRIYVRDGNTLQWTMQVLQDNYGFKASERKWKMKLKEWAYEKYLSSADWKVIVAKADKRAREEGKETVFRHLEKEIPHERIDSFKRRKVTKAIKMASPPAETPANITYYTPKSDFDCAFDEEHSRNGQTSDQSLDICPPSPGSPNGEEDLLISHSSEDGNNILADSGVDTSFGTEITEFSPTSPEPSSSPSRVITYQPPVATQNHSGHTRAENVTHPLDSFPEEIQQLVTRHINAGNFAEARLISLLGIEGSKLSRQHHECLHRYRLNESELMNRQILSTYEHSEYPSSIRTFRQVYRLAICLYENRKFVESDELCLRAITGFKTLDDLENLVSCEWFLGESLQLRDHDVEATPILLSALMSSLKYGSGFDTERVLASIQISCHKVRHGGSFLEVASVVLAMQKLLKPALHQRNPRTPYFCPQMVFQGIKLAAKYQTLEDLCSAEILFSALIPEVEHFPDAKYGVQKCEVYTRFALQRQQRRNLVEVVLYLKKAYQCLERADEIIFNRDGKMKDPFEYPEANKIAQLALGVPKDHHISRLVRKSLKEDYWTLGAESGQDTTFNHLTANETKKYIV